MSKTMTTGMTIALILGTVTAAFATIGNPAPIPEPSTIVLILSGIGGAVLYARSRRTRK